ncbi:type II secretion system F family protein [Kitasatospora sp. NPDC058965]|uniref:type II secretion system F family protein n=1 Tax=Kitasatospora sp. NPDC058965 TaxID=3346682 RepID=UPI0036BA73A2
MNNILLSPDTLLALLSGLVAGGGVALLIASLVGWPRRAKTGPNAGQRLADFARRRGGAAAIAGLLVLITTQWVVAAAAVALVVLFRDKLFGGAKAEREGLAYIEGLAGWVESLRDTLAGAVGLEQAIQASSRAAAPALRPHLLTMIDRLRAKTPLQAALDQFADDLGDGSADVIIIALKDNARQRGPGLRDVLSELAQTARDEADMRRRILAQRSGTRRSVQIVTWVVVTIPLGTAIFNPTFVEPYRSVQGQGVLTVVVLFFTLALVWLRKLSVLKPPERLLLRSEVSR